MVRSLVIILNSSALQKKLQKVYRSMYTLLFVPLTHPLASVRGSYNAIYIKGNGIDDAMFYGRGAGSLPTGSSVVSDIMEVAKNIAFESTGMNLNLFYFDQKNIYSPGKIQSSYYIRLAVDNKTGVLAKIATKLAEQKISVLPLFNVTKILKRQCLLLLHLNAHTLIF